MGACIFQKNDRQFSMNDFNGMEKYYTVLPKKKADVLRWMTSSAGPWKIPKSFSCFQITDAKVNPIKVSNEDEMRMHALQLKMNMSHSHADRRGLSIDSASSMRAQTNSDWSTGW